MVTICFAAKAKQELGVEDLEEENAWNGQGKTREDGFQILPQQSMRLDSVLTSRKC